MPRETVPYRSPFGPLTNLQDIIRGKKFADLGCGGGDLLEYAKEHLGASEVRGWDAGGRKRKTAGCTATIVVGDFLKTDFLSWCADVYHIWIETPETELQAISKIKKSGTNATIIVAYNTGSTIPCPVGAGKCKLYCTETLPGGHIERKFMRLTKGLDKMNQAYDVQRFMYDEGRGCRQRGQWVFVVLSL